MKPSVRYLACGVVCLALTPACAEVSHDMRVEVTGTDVAHRQVPVKVAQSFVLGRFGSYFEHTLRPDHPLELNYRIWLQRGEMDAPDVAALSHSFVNPPNLRPSD